ncbi:MAG TPA: ABC transporter ATP-binding protein [Candidatus Acidoferrales bacterium]|nr:ABC transporter ATP-binding protein [Candidatus Acidoferrales bacterium]
MLKVEDIHTYYGESYVLQGVSVDVPAGTVAAVLGRNGMGKTTLVRSVIGLTPARAGKIFFRGEEITHRPTHEIARMGIGWVPQGRRIFPSLTVRENIEVAMRPPAAGKSDGWGAEKLSALFPRLRERSRQPAKHLSGGEQQMLAIARALAGNPQCLLMDEPTEGLAPLIVREVGTLIDRLKNAGLAVLLVEQNLAFALRHAERVYILSKGRIVYQATPAELEQDHEIKARYLGV